MSDPLLTVIMPAYNADRFIAESIESVIAQTVEAWELIIVDDASTDGTLDIVAGYGRRDPRIRMISQDTNRGQAHARNIALDHARGELMAFLDSDDIWFPEKTAKQVAAMSYHGADLSYTSYIRRRHGAPHGTTATATVTVPARVSYRAMLRCNLIGCSTAMVRRSTCGKFRMPRLQVAEDHAYWLALLRDGTCRTVGITEPLVEYRVRDDSLSANKLISARYAWKLRREVEGFGFAKSVWLFAGYAYETLRLRLFSGKR